MKRSEINAAIRALIALADRYGFCLPPFAHWKPDEWRSRGREYDEIRTNGLGWDVTDFGKGAFAKCGLTLLTIRNGRHDRPDGKPYCEKLMMARVRQVTPMHFHWKKTEDIINRGGGLLRCKVSLADRTSEQPTDARVALSLDGVAREFRAGETLTLGPGQSVTLTPYVYHEFWAEDGDTLLGEVSSVNDDRSDNRFLDSLPRFPGIDEDEPPFRLLCHEYPPAR